MVEGAIRKSPIAVKKKGIFLSDPSPIIALPCHFYTVDEFCSNCLVDGFRVVYEVSADVKSTLYQECQCKIGMFKRSSTNESQTILNERIFLMLILLPLV